MVSNSRIHFLRLHHARMVTGGIRLNPAMCHDGAARLEMVALANRNSYRCAVMSRLSYVSLCLI